VVAISINRNPIFNKEEILEDPLDVLSIYSSLVTITTAITSTKDGLPTSSKVPSKLVALAYYSVKEYLILKQSVQGIAL
jgi:hypothetical protein